MNVESSATRADVAPADERQSVARLGIRDIRHAAVIKHRGGGEQRTVAHFDLSIGQPQPMPQDPMAQLIEILNLYGREVSVRAFHDILFQINNRLGAQSSHVVMRFPFFVTKQAPVSGALSLLDYDVSFIGQFDRDGLGVSIRVAVPVTCVCPRSRSVADYGAHFQRSLVTVSVHILGLLWIEELIETVEQTASCDLYGIIKRNDEKHLTEQAYDNPRRLEQLLRGLAGELQNDRRIAGYRVEAEYFQSQHNHSTYAMIEHDYHGR